MAKTNTKPVSGTRDFLPLAVLRRNYVIRIIEEIYQRYGFEPLETSVMERLDTLLGKYGEEGDQLIFRIAKRGAKLERALADNPGEGDIADEGLRYDLTVPLARVYAEYRNELPRYFKRYQIAPVYRADRPAKGRYREFFQCDVDIVGSKSQLVEAEVLNAGAEVLQALGFGQDGFTIRLNHRQILQGMMAAASVPKEQRTDALVAIDKLDKIGLEGVQGELLARGLDPAVTQALLHILDSAPAEVAPALDWLESLVQQAPEAEQAVGRQGVAELRQTVAFIQGGPAQAHLRVDPYMVRGLSYYTGVIFEAESDKFRGTIAAGGRYDDLVGMFTNQTIPACGFSLGLERILLIMEEQGMFPQTLAGQAQILVTQFDESTVPTSLALAHTLRQAGLRVDLYPDMDRYGRQFRYAEERHIPWALLIGPDEMALGQVTIKNLVGGEQISLAQGEVINWFRQRLEVDG
jgi:histidyl-tRNA synthetase